MSISNPLRIGIDLGGTKIEAIALDIAGKELARRRIATPQGDYAATLEAVAVLVESIEAEVGGKGTVGVGIPGALSLATGLVKNANSTALNGRPFDRDLTTRLGRAVRLANDANCFALSEATDGAAAGTVCAFGVIIGTGTGGGIVVNGKLLVGMNAIGGEWGHNPLPWPRDEERPGSACYCGRYGCIETFLSGPGIARDHRAVTGETLTAEEIVQRAEMGDAATGATLARYEDRMARALAHIINVIDPDVIVLGGGLSKVERLYRNVPPLWRKYVFSDEVRTRLLPPRYGDSSGVRGAAWLSD